MVYLDNLETLSNLLQQRRALVGISQSEMSQRLGVSLSAVSAWEGRGSSRLTFPKQERLASVAVAYEVPFDELEAAYKISIEAHLSLRRARSHKQTRRSNDLSGLSGGICRASILRQTNGSVFGSRFGRS